MAKTLYLFRHSDKTPDGKHISAKGRHHAYFVGRMARIYGDTTMIHHVFWGPLIRTTETAIAMMTDNTMFDSAEMHDPIVGLGDDAMFAEMVTPEMKQAIKEGKSNFDALFAAHGSDSLNTFITAGQQAIDQMFAAMKDGEVGVGVFHDPTIPLMGWAHGLQEVRSLDSMQAIVFTMNDDGSITARWQ